MKILNILMIYPGAGLDEGEDFANSIEFNFNKLGSKVFITSVFECESILYRIKNAEPDQYDFFIIKSNKNNPGCYSHSIIDNLLSNNNTNKAPKLLISNKPLYDRLTITNKDVSFDSNGFMVQISQQDSRNPSLIREVMNSLIVNQPVLYISYGNDDNNFSREVIDEFESLSTYVLPYVRVSHDMNQLKTGDNLQAFMKSMQEGSIILLLINDKYLKSEYCMQELIYIFEKLKGRIYPVFLDADSGLHNRKGYLSTLNYWENELQDIQKTISKREKNGFPEDKTLRADEKLYSGVVRILPEFREYINNFFTLPIKSYQSQKYLDIFQKIHDDLALEGHIKLFTDEDHLKDILNR